MSDAPEIRSFICFARHRDESRRPRWSLVSAWTAADAIAQSELYLRRLPCSCGSRCTHLHQELILTRVEPFDRETHEYLFLHQEDRW